ncbi:hypothetical protein GCM10011352_25350 [Marinobacterium zhoushanense]|uniref:Uncharacterized protein n=1 Tax=Marinobacterium zhoushanense TaxID=1679163 RepID=A0ABQ1KF11_9GAMM|nr:hypothetical protein GCM10011352_25350 [Marinobacterium zhoushanense]
MISTVWPATGEIGRADQAFGYLPTTAVDLTVRCLEAALFALAEAAAGIERLGWRPAARRLGGGVSGGK